jgi:hypothetical protein
MDALYLLTGLGYPSSARPWTATEAQLILGRLNGSALNGPGQALYDHVSAEISRPLRLSLDKLVSLNAHVDAVLEAYAHTNDSDYVLESDWLYGYEERRPMLKIALEMAAGSLLYITTDLQYRRNRFSESDKYGNTRDIPQGVGALIPPAHPPAGTPSSNGEGLPFPYWSQLYSAKLSTNAVLGFDEFDFAWPKRALISFGGEHWNLNLARDRMQWGNGHSGNFVIDSHTDFNDFIRFSFFSDRFRYEWLNVFFTDPNIGEQRDITRTLMAHRLEFRIIPSLVFAVSENVMHRNTALNLSYLNPAFIYHNLFDRNLFNAIAQLELDYTPIPRWRVYTQFVIDQLRAPAEAQSQSDAWGALGGIEYASLIGPGVFTISLEGAYTTPELYRRDIIDFLRADTFLRVTGPDPLVLEYIGYPYGGDAMVARIDASYLFPGSASLSARLFGMIHGRMHFFVSHNDEDDNTGEPNLSASTPSGDEAERELTFIASLRGNYPMPFKKSPLKLSFWAELDLVMRHNKLMYGDPGTTDSPFYKEGIATDLQCTLGAGMRL